jgi:GT2 family glycosyltransferase/nucleoside-diphosphate-sugar epimerase
MPKPTIVTNTSMPSVSVVMVSYYTGAILWRSIDSVLSQAGLQELIIVDNGNPRDVTARLERLAERDNRVRIITGHGNVGFASGCNKGVAAASSEYILLLNPDCLLPEKTLLRVMGALEENPEYWLAGACIMNIDGTEQAGSRRNILTPRVALVENFRLYRFVPSSWLPRMNVHQEGCVKNAHEVPAISGAFMMLKRELYHAVGGMDETYFLHVEDLDFCLAIRNAGGKILHVPDVKVTHYRSTSKVSEGFIERHKTRSFIYYFNKHFAWQYPKGFSQVMATAIYARYVVRMLIRRFSPEALKSFLRFRAYRGRKSDNLLRKELLASHTTLAKNVLLFGDASVQEIVKHRNPVLLAGATGQVGIATLRRLLAAGCEVVALYHSTVIDFEHPNLTWCYANLEHGTMDLPKNFRPQTVIYTAGLWYLPQFLEKLAALGVKRLVCFTSTSIESKANSHNAYEQKLVDRFRKAEDEVTRLCDANNIAWTIIRPTLIYGIGLDKNISSIVKFIRAFGFFPVYGEAAGLRQPVHADDLATAVVSVLNNPKTFSERFNLCGDEKVSYRAMVERVFKALGKKERIVPIPFLPQLIDGYSWLTRQPETNGEIARRMNQDLVFSDAKARDFFDYDPRAFLVGGKQDIDPEFGERDAADMRRAAA